MSNLKSLLVVGLFSVHALMAYEAQAGDHGKDWIHVESYTLGSTQATSQRKVKAGVAQRPAAATETLDIVHAGFLDEPAAAPARRRSGDPVARYNFTQAWPAAPQKPATVTLKLGKNNAAK